MLSRLPPSLLVILAILSIQIGAAIATGLFSSLGADGTVAARLFISAVLLLLVAGPRLRALPGVFLQHWQLLLPFGLCMAVMNLFFYQAIARIPLGAAVAIEFIGPLGVAAFNSRHAVHFLWVGLAAFGVLLLSPLSGAALDPLGVLYALLAGVGWAIFILLSSRVSAGIAGNDGLALAMAVAALALLPFFLPVAGVLVQQPLILLAAFGVAVLSTTLPFTFEFEALKRLPARAYGILVSLEPAAAAVVGALMLGERIGVTSVIAVGCVVIAAAGISLSDQT